MARYAKPISAGNSNIQHLSCGVLALCFPMSEVKRVLEECRRLGKRTRDLPPQVMVFFVIALSLFPDVAYQGVLRWLLSGLRWLGSSTTKDQDRSACAKSSLADARWRLGAEPLRRLHEQLARPLSDSRLPGSYWKGRHLVALDGSLLALQDTKENAEFYGRPSNQKGAGAWPLARFVALAEVGTHILFKAVWGTYHDSEITLARKLVGALESNMLCLADRLFPGFGFWKEASAGGSALVWRAKIGLPLTPLRTLEDGSWLAHWHPSSRDQAHAGEPPHLVRVVEYQLDQRTGDGDQPPACGKQETYRLLTNLLDPAQGSALELAALYPQRWEIELSIQENKSILRKGRLTLRSKSPEMVEQEFWGLLLGHYVVRKMMALAALETGADPDTLSYRECAQIIIIHVAGPALPLPPPDQSRAVEGTQSS
jgi:hypothetical protein